MRAVGGDESEHARECESRWSIEICWNRASESVRNRRQAGVQDFLRQRTIVDRARQDHGAH
jgi:hypothetical protein